MTCLVLAGMSACANRDNEAPSAIGLSLAAERTLLLHTTCAEEVQAVVEELPDRVEVTGLRGTRVSGECTGSASVLLKRSLGDRSVWVDGRRWVPLEGDCPFGDFAPPDRTQPAGCTPRK